MATEKLYSRDSYLQEFTARILRAERMEDGRWGIVLDKTAFYPEGGGQPSDAGSVNGIPVIEVREEGEVIHVTGEHPGPDTVLGKIDWTRRFDHMQQHSGEHLLCGAFFSLLGANSVGFHLGRRSSQIDLDIEVLTEQQVKDVELLSNEIVFRNLPVRSLFAGPDRLEQFRPRKQPAKGFPEIRLVEIKGFDCCPCGGTHVAATGEIGLIKIRHWERYKSLIRVDFVCGRRALEDYRQKNSLSQHLSARLSSPAEALPQSFDRLWERMEETNKELALTKKKASGLLAEILYRDAEEINGTRLVAHIMEEASARDIAELAGLLTTRSNTITLLAGISPDHKKASLIFSCSDGLPADMNKQLKSVLPLINGKGGGTPLSAQGGGTETERISEALAAAKENIKSQL